MNHNFQTSIELLAREGFTILQLIHGGYYHYFYVYQFHTAEENSVSYHQAIGINITNFLEVNHGNVDKGQFLFRFNQHIDQSELMRVEFSKDAQWFKWASYSEINKK